MNFKKILTLFTIILVALLINPHATEAKSSKSKVKSSYEFISEDILDYCYNRYKSEFNNIDSKEEYVKQANSVVNSTYTHTKRIGNGKLKSEVFYNSKTNEVVIVRIGTQKIEAFFKPTTNYQKRTYLSYLDKK